MGTCKVDKIDAYKYLEYIFKNLHLTDAYQAQQYIDLMIK